MKGRVEGGAKARARVSFVRVVRGMRFLDGASV